ncbi:hypothetical protein ACFYWN_37660 [Streptomyces sp. NPDC002917]|uniref:hypothetical protein n=1 Tax=Streptomyces sp. NPDC002917 TaxID=3364671 RepID=UPI0036B4E592
MKTNPDNGGKYSVGLNGVFNRTIHHLRVFFKKAERGPLDLGYEALRGAAYQAGNGLVAMLIVWASARR